MRLRLLLTGLLTAGLALGPASSALAGPSTLEARPIATLSAGNLILEPTDRGYVGTLRTSITWNGSANGQIDLSTIEPVAGSWTPTPNGEFCQTFGMTGPLRNITCIVGLLQPGETRDVIWTFRVLTTTERSAMSVAAQKLRLVHQGTPIGKAVSYKTTFRGTNGSLRNPRPYVQDTQTDMSVSVTGPVTMVRQEGGYYLGRVPVTVRWNGDAPHYGIFIRVDGQDPASTWLTWETEPFGGLPCGDTCAVPGPVAPESLPFMPGESSTFDLIVYADGATPPGSHTVVAHISSSWATGLTDVSPADDDAAFTAVIN